MLCLILKPDGVFFFYGTNSEEVLRSSPTVRFLPVCLSALFFFFNTVLQLCLQQRRTREQLVEQGIMPREYSDHTITVHSACMTR